MHASEARELAEEIRLKIVSKNIETILDEIQEKAKNGKFQLILYNGLSTDEKTFFERLGYKIKYIDGDYRESGYTTISW